MTRAFNLLKKIFLFSFIKIKFEFEFVQRDVFNSNVKHIKPFMSHPHLPEESDKFALRRSLE